MPNHEVLSSPFILNRRLKKKVGRPTPHIYLHRIAYTETQRGIKDDEPTLLFYGAPWELLKDVCQYLCKVMNGKVADLRLRWEHSCRRRNGKCYWRVAVGIVQLDEQFMSLKNFTMMLISRMKQICNCTVRHYRLETFLNL